MNTLKININEPCHELWDEMTPIEKGAWCKSCCKEVTDFSPMSDEEIVNYFLERKDTPTCGRFRKTQLNRPLIYISPEVFVMKIPFWKKFLAILLVCFSVLMTGCDVKIDQDTSSNTFRVDTPVITDNMAIVDGADQGNKPTSCDLADTYLTGIVGVETDTRESVLKGNPILFTPHVTDLFTK